MTKQRKNSETVWPHLHLPINIVQVDEAFRVYLLSNEKKIYVDGHEKPATVEYRHKFCERYLQNEARTHRCIQIKQEQAQYLQEMTWWQKKLGIIIVVVTIHQWWSFILMTPGSLLQC